MGIILFERLGWGVGQVGIGGVLIIFLVAETQAILTVLSLSAMCTNGNMMGGDSYFMISRTLGPEFGGSIGILFYAAYCVGVAFYCTGFAEELVDTWYGSSSNHPWLVIGWASFIHKKHFHCSKITDCWVQIYSKIELYVHFFCICSSINSSIYGCWLVY